MSLSTSTIMLRFCLITTHMVSWGIMPIIQGILLIRSRRHGVVIGLPYPEFATLINFPERSCYKLMRADMDNQTIDYINCLCRVAYLAKDRTKIRGAGYRNFGLQSILSYY